MKKILLIGLLLLCGCERNISRDLAANKNGKLTINGKECEVLKIDIGNSLAPILFVDCGLGSSVVTYQQGKTQQTVGQFTPPEVTGCDPNNHK